MKKITLISLVFLVLLMIGCSSDTEYNPPTKTETTAAEEPSSATQEVATPEPETKKEQPKTQTFSIGDTATDNELKVTVNSVEFKNIINYNPGYTTIPIENPEGSEFIIVDITIENILTDKTQTPVLSMDSYIMDQDGYSYQVASVASVALDKVYDNQDILPGMKKRGKIAYSVPVDATDLKFVYKFDLFVGTTAIFDVK